MKMVRLELLMNRPLRQVIPLSYHWVRRRLLGAERPRAFGQAHPCVFVLSTGRVGSQTLAELFRMASNVLAYHEPTPRLFALSGLAYMYEGDSVAQEMLAEAFREARAGLLLHSLACHRGYVETGPHATFLARAIEQAIPEVKFIHVVRDPRAVVRSGMRRGWYGGHHADHTRIVPRSDSEYAAQWDRMDAFEKNVWLWTETNRWIMEFGAALPRDRMLRVHAEDLFSGQEECIDQLYGFVDAHVPPEHRVARLLGRRLNQQDYGTFAESEEWTQGMLDSLLRIAGGVADELGYGIAHRTRRVPVALASSK